MTDTTPWEQRAAARLLADPDAIEAPTVDRSVSRPPAPRWVERLAARAVPQPTDIPPAA